MEYAGAREADSWPIDLGGRGPLRSFKLLNHHGAGERTAA